MAVKKMNNIIANANAWRAHYSVITALLFVLALPGSAWFSASTMAEEGDRPNIILIMTDDQGVGDLGVMGNPVIQTPNIDRLASESAWLTNFYVHPVCAPTRACLLTGRYNYRTRVVDTWIGRAMMEPEEVTLAEVLRDAGYATGIFGKWHLGDCYPMRAMDQGFEVSVVHRGGGIGQPSDPLEARRQYSDPILWRDGVKESFSGYCTDIYYDEAIRFIESSQDQKKPFFVYLPDNTPHGPFHDVPEDLYQRYKQLNITRDSFGSQPAGHHPFREPDADFLSRVFAMIGNVDRNIGRLLAKLDERELAENTIVIFMCDNGPNSRRFTGGYRGHKASVYEGGIRSPFFARWPAAFPKHVRVEQIAAHIDLLPTLLACCGVDVPENVKLDGIDLSGLLNGTATEIQDRHLIIQSHRGNAPVRYHHCAVRTQDWKLVHHSGFGKATFAGDPEFELFDMKHDPLEQTDVSGRFPEQVRKLQQLYDKWFDDVGSTRSNNYAPPRIVIDPDQENPVVLTRQDWRRDGNQGWGNAGRWLLRTEKPLRLVMRCRMPDDRPTESIRVSLSGVADWSANTEESGLWATIETSIVPAGNYELSAASSETNEPSGVLQVFVESRNQ